MKESDGPPHLRRALDRWDIALLTVGSVIGSGIFLVPGEVAIATMMSPLLASLVWIAGAALSLCGAFTFAELARIRPDAGGLYIYIRDGHGPVAAYVFGWMSGTYVRGIISFRAQIMNVIRMGGCDGR